MFGFTWDRDVNYSFEPTQPYYVANTLGGQIRRHIRGRVDASIGAQRAVLSYRSFDTATPVAPRTDVTTSYSADIGHRLNRTVRLSLDVTATDRKSPAAPGRNYRSTRAGVSVLYVLPG